MQCPLYYFVDVVRIYGSKTFVQAGLFRCGQVFIEGQDLILLSLRIFLAKIFEFLVCGWLGSNPLIIRGEIELLEQLVQFLVSVTHPKA